jgi:hypothetical protein
MTLEKYSIGIGDRFGHQGSAQLQALLMAAKHGLKIVPVWNKSNREHSIIGTLPGDTRREADEAVRILGWRDAYYVDADHIGVQTVERYLASSNFFTIDIADFIGKPAPVGDIDKFVEATRNLEGALAIPGIAQPICIDRPLLERTARKYLAAVTEAAKVYRLIVASKDPDTFVAEISLDEADVPQSPAELLFILAAIARERIPIQTIAPKFTGSFLKGVDYVGDSARFAREFDENLAVITFAVSSFRLPANLKLSVHSGSDKFSLYPLMHQALKRHDAGLHLKTAGTTWLEEVIGLAEADGDGLAIAKEIYIQSYHRRDELSKPYLSVIDINPSKLPSPEAVALWSSEIFAGALRHDQGHQGFNPHFRQLVHIGYKVAAEMGSRFTALLTRYRDNIARNVAGNIYERHIVPLFLGTSPHK